MTEVYEEDIFCFAIDFTDKVLSLIDLYFDLVSFIFSICSDCLVQWLPSAQTNRRRELTVAAVKRQILPQPWQNLGPLNDK